MRTYTCGANNMTRTALDPIERVLANSEHVRSGCIEWKGLLTKKGYGVTYSNRKAYPCHRTIYEHIYEPVPPGMCVLHDCDNRKCVNPRHLYLGTNADNIEDKIKRDRSGRKLNIEKVRQIKRMLAEGVPQKDIAAQFGVANATISHINHGNKWAHVHDVGGTDSVKTPLESVG